MLADYKDKKITVIGLARSGQACANLLRDSGAQVSVTDSADDERLRGLAHGLRQKGIAVELGRHTREFIEGRDLIVVSPGVGNDSRAIAWAEERRIPIISEIELAWSLCKGTVTAITGTNGKTTVSSLLGIVLKKKFNKTFACGNIGLPFSSCVRDIGPDDAVSLEVSSFQLERIIHFKPRVSVILNFTQDHLDRSHRGYSSLDEYLCAKKRIFLNQDKDDELVLNADDPVVSNLAKEAQAKVVFFSVKDILKESQRLNFNLNPNHLAVIAASSIFGISIAQCVEVFNNFKGVEHRLEFVRSVKGVDFINDSKATNVDSTAWALKYTQRPAILIAGGRDKGSDYSVIADLIKQKVKLLVLIGEAQGIIKKSFAGLIPVKEAESLKSAVEESFKQSRPGDCVLLSPMCASFDMFENYEHRGRSFKEIVNRL